MPLPLLVPIGLGLTALATGAYGAKKGLHDVPARKTT